MDTKKEITSGFHFFFTEGNFEINLITPHEKSLDIFRSLCSIFAEVKGSGMLVTATQRATVALKEKVHNFVKIHGETLPKLRAFDNRFQKLVDDEYFFLLPPKDYSTAERLDFVLRLQSINGSQNLDDARKSYTEKLGQIDTHFKDVLTNYEIAAYDQQKRYKIGQEDKKRRICRFCEGTETKGSTFRKKAHAISEGLGNKTIILNDECDECNEYFGEKIEPSLIHFLDPFRAYYGVKGASGNPQITYQNATIVSVEGVMCISTMDTEWDPINGMSLELRSARTYVPINIYKTFCKMVISCIDEEQLPFLTDTIEWLRNEKIEHKKLPKVASGVVPAINEYFPQIALYVRKTDHTGFPHIVGEFFLGNLIYVFIVPFSKKDKLEFIADDEYQNFLNKFQQYRQIDWKFNDLNDSTEHSLATKLAIRNPNSDRTP